MYAFSTGLPGRMKSSGYTDDVDLAKRLVEWEHFYNYHRPYGAFAGKTPYEVLRERLQ